MLRELERYYEDYCESIRQEAEKLRAEEMPEPTEDLFAIYENTGNRLIYEDVYFERRKFLAVFGLKAILDGEERDIQKLEDILEGICAEECWALPAHVNRMTDENWRTYVDLFAAETAQTLAEIASLLGGRLSQETVRTVEQEVTGPVSCAGCWRPSPPQGRPTPIGNTAPATGAPSAAAAWEALPCTCSKTGRKS